MRLTASICGFVATFALVAACGKSARHREPAGGAASGGGSAAGTGPQSGTTSVTEADAGESGGGSAPLGGSAGNGGDGGVATGGLGGATAGRAGGEPASGGKTAGGAPNGGAANAGAAAGTPSIAVPDGCTPVVQHVGGAFCSSEMTCGDEHLILSCNPGTSTDANTPAPWKCLCTRGSDTTEFDFPTATGTQTCEVGADACLHPQQPTGDPTCTLSDTIDGQICTVVENCTRFFELDGVMVGTSTEDWSAACTTQSEGITGCNCTSGLTPDHLIQGADVSQGCDFLKPLCTGDEPTPAGDWSCEPAEQENYPPGYGCASESTCERPLLLNDGSTLKEAAEYSISCIPNNESKSDHQVLCGCNGTMSTLALGLDVSADDGTACQVMTGACTGLASLELSGSPTCTTSDAQASATGCQQTLDCSQAATTQGLDVTVLTTASVSCSADGDAWDCTCSDTGESSTLKASDATFACTQAMAQCPPVAPTVY